MKQDKIFINGEGDKWYRRNKTGLSKIDKVDWPLFVLNSLKSKNEIRSVIELGCSNGYRLSKIKAAFPDCVRLVGVDAGNEAIEDGRKLYPELELHHGLLSEIPINEEFDLTIVNFVLHWVDRRTLFKSLSEIDKVVKDGGFLILGDFLPDYPQRRAYHHLVTESVYTYKQDYAKIFESFAMYREVARFTYDHDHNETYLIQSSAASARSFCALLHKSSEKFYQEV